MPGYEVYKHAMNAGYLDTILIYLKQKPIFGETVDGFKESYFDFINFLYTAYFLSILNMKCISKCKAKRSLLIVSLISVLAPLSWYILGKPHSFWHTHINTILLFIPTIFLQAILIAVCIRDLIGHIKAKVSKLFIR